MKRCQNCGRQVSNMANFCENCGLDLRNDFFRDRNQLDETANRSPVITEEPMLVHGPPVVTVRSVHERLKSGRYIYRKPRNQEEAHEKIASAINARRGQKAFRQLLLKEYESRCLITGANIVDVLEAAHIRPYCVGGPFACENGLLLRADIHTLFDLDLIAIDTNTMTVITSIELAGTEYGSLDGKPLLFPPGKENIPDKEGLDNRRQEAGL